MSSSSRSTRSVLVGVVAVTLVACGSDDPGASGASPSPSPPAVSPAPTTPTDPSPSPSGPGPTEPGLPSEVLPPAGPVTPLPTEGASMSPDLQSVVDAAIADLAERVGADQPAIEVLVARPETFPNGALGCPKEGEMYTQALVDGYRVVLRRGERVWLYTAPENGQPRLCPSGEKDGGHGFVPPPGFDE